jgi:hypothetical protein
MLSQKLKRVASAAIPGYENPERASPGKDVRFESGLQVNVSRCESPEFPNPTLESPDELVYVEGDPGPLLIPIPVTQVATPGSVGTARIETVNKPTAKDLVEPFITATAPRRR